MKKVLIAVSILILGCAPKEPGPVTESVIRVVKNESGHPVTITSYFNEDYYNKVVEYKIPDDGVYSEDGQMTYGEVGVGEPESNIEWVGNVDSVIVTFGDEKRQKHCTVLVDSCVDQSRSIILAYFVSDGGSGYQRSGYESPIQFTYTITETDFENADEIK